ncbi:MAG: HEAT repeat domain-containing protein, partial [Candidatus Nanohaloarchaea archaeon]
GEGVDEPLARVGVPLEGLLAAADDESEAMRRTIASSLGQFGTARPIDTLVELLSDESDLVRRAATFSLIEILSNVSTDRSDELRSEIVDRMSAGNDPSIVESLVEIVEEGSQLHQRRNAVWMLGRVTGEESESEAIDALIGALDDDDHLIRQFAATSLTEIGGQEVEKALIAHLDEAPSDDAMAMAAFTLGNVGGERAKSRLDQLVDQTDSEEVRRRAFSALSKLGGADDAIGF